MKFILAGSYDNYISAHLAVGQLEAEFINCYLLDEHSAGLTPFLYNTIGGIKLMVAEPQAERARGLLLKHQQQTIDS